MEVIRSPAMSRLAEALSRASKERDAEMCAPRSAAIVRVAAPYGPGDYSADEVAPILLALFDAVFCVAFTYAARNGASFQAATGLLVRAIETATVEHRPRREPKGGYDPV